MRFYGGNTMTIQLTKTYEVLSEHTFTIQVSEEEYDAFTIDNHPDEEVDYEDMFDFYEAKGHNVEHDEQSLDYQSQGVTVEFL